MRGVANARTGRPELYSCAAGAEWRKDAEDGVLLNGEMVVFVPARFARADELDEELSLPAPRRGTKQLAPRMT